MFATLQTAIDNFREVIRKIGVVIISYAFHEPRGREIPAKYRHINLRVPPMNKLKHYTQSIGWASTVHARPLFRAAESFDACTIMYVVQLAWQLRPKTGGAGGGGR